MKKLIEYIFSYSKNIEMLSQLTQLNFADIIQKLKETAANEVARHIVHLQLSSIEEQAYHKALNISPRVHMVKGKFFGITPLLECGEFVMQIHLASQSNNSVASATLQPFCNAVEIMLNVCFVYLSGDEIIREFITEETRFSRKRKTIRELIGEIENEALRVILEDWRHFRNLTAHTYQAVPIAAAKTFALRTYENIQRLEMIINPFEL